MLCFVLQRTPTNENNGGTEWQGIQQLLQIFNNSRHSHLTCYHQLEIFIYNSIATPSATRKLTHMAEFFEIARL